MLVSQALRASKGNIIIIGSTSTNNGTGTTINISVPAGSASGDLLFVALSGASTTATWTGPVGWSERIDANGRSIYSLASYDGTTSSYTFTTSSAGAKGAIMVCVRNATWRVIGIHGSSVTNPSAPAIILTTSNNMRFAVAYSTNAGVNFTAPSGFTDILGITTNTSIKVCVDNTRRGAITTSTADFISDGAGRAVQFAIN